MSINQSDKKISQLPELPSGTGLTGFKTVGVKDDANGFPVTYQVDLSFMQTAADNANTKAALADSKAALVQTRLDTADADHTQAGQDHSTASSDHSSAEADHATAGTDHAAAQQAISSIYEGKNKFFSIDFGADEDTVSIVNVMGALHIKRIAVHNCATVKLTHGSALQQDITPGTVNIAVGDGETMVFEITRTTTNLDAVVSVKFLEDIFVSNDD